MTTIPLTLTLTASVTLGCILGLRYLRGERGRPLMIGAHLILGILALEQMAMLLAGAPDGDHPTENSYGRPTLFLFFVAVMAGVIAALIRHRRREANIALAGHVAVASAGVLAYLVWISRL